jgi:MOSC domain-containing protein YiiM
MSFQRRGTVKLVMVMPPGQKGFSSPVDEVQVNWEGFAGDSHAGLTMRAGGGHAHFPRGAELRNTRQISIVSQEELERVAAKMGLPHLEAEWLGANLLLAGIPHLTLLPPGTRLYFPGEAALVVEGENKPCTSAGGEIQKHFPEIEGLDTAFPKAANGLRGLMAWVERPGVIRTGDEAIVHMPEQGPFPG